MENAMVSAKEQVRLGNHPDDMVVSNEDLETFITFLNDNSEDYSKPRLGKEIEFAERNGFYNGAFLNLIRERAKDPYSPILSQLRAFVASHDDFELGETEFSRVLFLQLRDFYRRKFALAPLTYEERANWPKPREVAPGFERPSPARKPAGEKVEYHMITSAEASLIADYVKTHFPDIARCYHALICDSAAQGYKYPDDVGNSSLVERVIGSSAEAVLYREYVTGTWLAKDFLRFIEM
jgi:hypothetical protein